MPANNRDATAKTARKRKVAETGGMAMASQHMPPARATPSRALATLAPAPQAESHAAEPASTLQQALRYQIDRWQRSILFLDILRERANNMLAHEEAGMPALLDFEYETILDARRFERPANYALLRITRCHDTDAADCLDDSKPPVIIIDPRAGHGPGIGGFKRDSEVGMALHEGHATYFVIFFPQPCPNQTLADVLHALRRFVEEVGNRHPGKAPVLYGNCQAGWAATLLAADCEGLTGVTVMNGSPLSYWAGDSQANPMRLAGGLLGGSWMTRLLADLGNGKLDGAWLVQNFENLNPANTLWDKNYRLFTQLDTERERFLEFERWWTAYHFLSREEIVAIVENLFIGNKLERGVMRICDCCYVDLKRIRNPLVIFASSGDNITPPHQALNWIPTVYPTTTALKQAGQRIVYLLNGHVGHLGIFVSAGVAKLEHRAILESLGELEALPPGLYEMKISNPTGDPDCRKPQYSVHFEERQVEQIQYPYPQQSFEKVHAVSEWNAFLYQQLMSPWITAFANPLSAEMLKRLHPMRLSHAVFSDKLNPWMVPVKAMATWVASARMPADDSNPLVAVEGEAGNVVSNALDSYRQFRDAACERLFSMLYGGRAG
ncbi:MAG TPA: poly(3-hydroxyalkanoate) synthetase [Oxalobacteraceae bacterium]|nr:poly(3-hydroxyalkanoate) synthetase [Oxalobacteraceae bacterium]